MESITVGGKTYFDADAVARMLEIACRSQREICEAQLTHHKFGVWKCKKGAMLNAPVPQILTDIRNETQQNHSNDTEGKG